MGRFGHWTHQVLILTLASLTATACTRKNANDSTLKFRLPEAKIASSVSAATSGGVSTLWGLAAPTSITQVNCYGVLVSRSPAESTTSCFDSNSNSTFNVSQIEGLYAPGTEVSLALSSGSGQTIYLLGFVTDNASRCSKDALNQTLNLGSFSAPRIIASKVVTIRPGENTETMTATLSNPASVKYCQGSKKSFGELPGTGPTTALITVSEGVSHNFGIVPNGGHRSRTLTLNNIGSQTAATMGGTGLTPPFSFSGGTYPGTGGNCGASLNAGASCTVVVDVNQTTVTDHSQTLKISYDNGLGNVDLLFTLAVQGGTAAALAISDGSIYDFGNVIQGGWRDHVFTLTNSGQATATGLAPAAMTAPFGVAGGSWPGVGGSCTDSLAGGATCTFVVRFSPTATGTATGNIVLDYDSGLGATQTLRSMQGQGVTAANLVFSNAPNYNYGSVVQSAASNFTFTVTNTGGSTATALTGGTTGSQFSYLGGTYPGTGGSCGSSLAAGASCIIAVRYLPNSLGAHAGAVSVGYHDGLSSMMGTLNLTGTGVAPALLNIDSGTTVNFGYIENNTTSYSTFTVTNTGGGIATAMTGLSMTAPFSFRGGSYPGVGGSCSTTLNPGSTCTIGVQISPVALGVQNGSAQISYHDGILNQTASRGMTFHSTVPFAITVGTLNLVESTKNGFQVKASYTNDGNLNASATLFYCNQTDSPGCIPSSGLSQSLTFSGGHILGTVSGLTAPFDPFDELNIEMVVNDPDGVSGGPFTLTLPLATQYQQLGLGDGHSCGLTLKNTIKCWGSNAEGQLGNNGAVAGLAAANVPGTDWISTFSNGRTSCALNNLNQAYCWGLNSFGQIGDGTGGNRSTPTAVMGGHSFSKISVGLSHTCGLRTDGKIYCWGENQYGQLGDNTTASRNQPMAVILSGTFTDVSAGTDSTCAVKSDQTIWCWGSNTYGQIGNALTGGNVPGGAIVSGGYAFSKVAVGASFACGLRTTGGIVCWGLNSFGQLGKSNTINSNIPGAEYSAATDWADLAAGNSHVCAKRVGGALYCWGQNTGGQLGDGTTTNRLVPVGVSVGLNFASIYAGPSHSCGLMPNGVARCWGVGLDGRLGQGATTGVSVPTPVSP